MSRHVHSGRLSGTASASTTRSALILTAAGQDGHTCKSATHRTENSYHMEPDQHFPVIETKQLVERLLESELQDRTYSATDSNQWALDLANKIKSKIKGMKYNRFRIVTFVAIGKRQEATINVASRCVWNKDIDQFVEGTYQNNSLYAVGLVYAIYQE